jgi:DNA-binding response OmpR family regulator
MIAAPFTRFRPMTDRTPTILFADDNPEIRAILRETFDGAGATLLEASDGEAALETILVERPDVVVLDVMMPNLNGWEIAKYVRSREDLSGVRILMLTAIGQTMNDLTSPLYGADAHLDKPFELEAVREKVAELLATAGLELGR